MRFDSTDRYQGVPEVISILASYIAALLILIESHFTIERGV